MSNKSRRSFLKATAAFAAAACAGAGRLAAKPLSMPVGLQLYSVRDLLPKDFAGTLAKVRAAGYTEMEAAGYYGHTAPEFRKAMDDAGLRCVSTHHSMADLKSRTAELIEYGHRLGLEYMICSYPLHRNPKADGPFTLDDFRYMAEELNKVGEKVKAAGMTFGYHNHTPEFGVEGGVVYYDELLRLTDPKLVVFEMDCGWVKASGQDPLVYLAKSPKRFHLLHIKDMVKDADGKEHSAVMGRGGMEWAPILRAATNLKHYFIEQEDFDMDVMEALRLDAEYMRKIEL